MPPAPKRMHAIEVDGLRHAFGGRPVLHGLSFSIVTGDIVALLGPNGAGKTTTIEILEGLRRPDAGTVAVLGTDPRSAGPLARARVGVVLQETRHDPYLTVAETVDLAAGWYPDPLPTEEVLSVVSLQDAAGRRVAKLSGGQQRRLDVALGLVGRPEVLFLDEPTTGFDPAARREAWEAIRRVRERGTTVVLTTHYLDEADALAERILVLAAGRIVDDASPATLGGRDRLCTISFTPAAEWRHDLPGGGRLDGARWTATVDDPTDTVHALGDWAAGRGVRLHDLTVHRLSLEDAYLQLIA